MQRYGNEHTERTQQKRPRPEELARARAFAATCRWRFARSVPADPHWYSLPDDAPDAEEREWFLELIDRRGWRGQFWASSKAMEGASGSRWTYLEPGDGYRYWLSRQWFAEPGDDRPMLNRALVDSDVSMEDV